MLALTPASTLLQTAIVPVRTDLGVEKVTHQPRATSRYSWKD